MLGREPQDAEAQGPKIPEQSRFRRHNRMTPSNLHAFRKLLFLFTYTTTNISKQKAAGSPDDDESDHQPNTRPVRHFLADNFSPSAEAPIITCHIFTITAMRDVDYASTRHRAAELRLSPNI